MSLITCPECKNSISDKANSCPKCGYLPSSNNVKVTNVYKGKNKIILGKLLASLGVLLFFISFPAQNPSLFVFAILSLIVGIIILIVGRFQNWYHN